VRLKWEGKSERKIEIKEKKMRGGESVREGRAESCSACVEGTLTNLFRDCSAAYSAQS
jgi:hypothetical protein